MRRVYLIFIVGIILFTGYLITKIELPKPRINSLRLIDKVSSDISKDLRKELNDTMYESFTEHLMDTYVLVFAPDHEMLEDSINKFKQDLETIKPALSDETYVKVNSHINKLINVKTEINNLYSLKKDLKDQLGENLARSFENDLHNLVIYNTFKPEHNYVIIESLKTSIEQVKHSLSDATYNQLQEVLKYYNEGDTSNENSNKLL